MAKTIVTHINPDLDALTAVWLLKRFGGDVFAEAEVKFVPAGETYKNQPVDSDPDIVHVDTSFGRFDHHQTDKRSCAASLVYEHLSSESQLIADDEALGRMVDVVLNIDFDAGDLFYPDASDDRYAFLFNERRIMSGWYRKYPGQSDKMVEAGLMILDGVYEGLKTKINSEKILATATEFKTKWGKGIAAQTSEHGFLPLAFTKGYAIGATKDPKVGNVRIKATTKGDIDLTRVYEAVKQADPESDWFFHASRKMLLNGSRTSTNMRPTKLSLKEVVEILKSANSQ